MADNPTGNGDSGGGGGHDSEKFGFLTRKLGPLPVWAWALMIVAAYYWYTHYGPGATAQQAQAPAATEKVVRSGGPTLETIHTSHQRPKHKRGDNSSGSGSSS